MLLDCHLLTPQHNFVTKCCGFYLFHFGQRNAAACQKKKWRKVLHLSTTLVHLWRVVEVFKVVHWSTKGLLLKKCSRCCSRCSSSILCMHHYKIKLTKSKSIIVGYPGLSTPHVFKYWEMIGKGYRWRHIARHMSSMEQKILVDSDRCKYPIKQFILSHIIA